MWPIERRRRLYSPDCVEGGFSEVHRMRKMLRVTMTVGNDAQEEKQMYRRMVRQALRLGLLMILVVLALVACEEDERQLVSKPRPLPEDPTLLYPNEYRSEEFEPSLSFRVVEGWSNAPLEAPDVLHIERQSPEEWSRLAFTNVQLVFKPRTLEVVEAPKDMVGWFQHHPYLETDKPEPISVGGVKGVQFDVVVEDLPKDHWGLCGSDCVDLFETGNDYSYALWSSVEGEHSGEKQRAIVLEGVKGETVTIIYTSPVPEFDELAPEAQSVLDSVKWRGSFPALG